MGKLKPIDWMAHQRLKARRFVFTQALRTAIHPHLSPGQSIPGSNSCSPNNLIILNLPIIRERISFGNPETVRRCRSRRVAGLAREPVDFSRIKRPHLLPSDARWPGLRCFENTAIEYAPFVRDTTQEGNFTVGAAQNAGANFLMTTATVACENRAFVDDPAELIRRIKRGE